MDEDNTLVTIYHSLLLPLEGSCINRQIEFYILICLWIFNLFVCYIIVRRFDDWMNIFLCGIAFIAPSLSPFLYAWLSDYVGDGGAANLIAPNASLLRVPLVLIYIILFQGAVPFLGVYVIALKFQFEIVDAWPGIAVATAIGSCTQMISHHLLFFGVSVVARSLLIFVSSSLLLVVSMFLAALLVPKWMDGEEKSGQLGEVLSSCLCATLALWTWSPIRPWLSLVFAVASFAVLPKRVVLEALFEKPMEQHRDREQVPPMSTNLERATTVQKMRSLLQSPPLVGERLELVSKLLPFYAQPDRGFTLLVVRGQRGIGKSRLLSALASSGDCQVFVGNCGEGGGCLPFQPLRQALGSLVNVNRLLASPSTQSEIISTLVESSPLSLIFGLAGSGSDASSQGPRLAQEIIKRFEREYERLNHKKRMVLVIEDVQAIDSESLAIVRQLVALGRTQKCFFTLVLR